MRLSADKSDSNYHDIAFYAEVFLDGAKLEMCVTADEDTGEAVCIARGPDGAILTLCDSIQYELRRGKVEIRILDDVPEWLLKDWRGAAR
jgi:hypothetical protein